MSITWILTHIAIGILMPLCLFVITAEHRKKIIALQKDAKFWEESSAFWKEKYAKLKGDGK